MRGKDLSRKVGWFFIFGGAVCFVILLGIGYDTEGYPEKQPWFTKYLFPISLGAGIVGIILVSKIFTKPWKRRF